MSEGIAVASGLVTLTVIAAAAIGGVMWGYPQYKVYSQRLAGEAALAEAESSREIKVREAKALLDSAEYTSQAEIKRAEGVAQANKILADSLGGPEGYLRWKYIDMLESKDGGKDIIYIPTEAGLPILEAGKRNSD